MDKIFCFGELLLRLSPELNRRWIQRSLMPVYIGGAELNVASALAVWNIPVRYFTALPENYLTNEIVEELKGKGIDLWGLQISGERIGTYYLPAGKDLKNAGVIYDRSNSSFSNLKPGSIDWDLLLQDCTWLHFSAINPALNENIALLCLEAVKSAKQRGIKISIDLNFRSKLWQYGKDPGEVMPSIVEHCDYIMGNIWSAHELLDAPLDPLIHDKNGKEAYTEHAHRTAHWIMKKFTGCKMVVNTFRFSENETVTYYATLDDLQNQVISPEFETRTVLDPVGSGDCFMAGFIYGICKEKSLQQVVDFAAAAAFGKLQEKGDSTQNTIEQVENLIKTYGKRRIYN